VEVQGFEPYGRLLIKRENKPNESCVDEFEGGLRMPREFLQGKINGTKLGSGSRIFKAVMILI